mmetsp:Transcript_16649/g.24662  ORF Transcript_16649/g.24662 Transcript_16649/m.24662 type:complete len:128 (+) Transcript_16649:155-538(+)
MIRKRKKGPRTGTQTKAIKKKRRMTERTRLREIRSTTTENLTRRKNRRKITGKKAVRGEKVTENLPGIEVKVANVGFRVGVKVGARSAVKVEAKAGSTTGIGGGKIRINMTSDNHPERTRTSIVKGK